MGVLKKTTEEINDLFDKVDGMPAEGAVGKTPVLTTGNTTTLEPGAQATSNVVNIGTDAEGNPKYRIDFGIPKGADGQDGSSSGGGGVVDSVQWSKILNKPAWVDSPSKPTYTASEVNAIPSGGLKTINGQSLEGEGNITIEGDGSSSGGIVDAPSDSKSYVRENSSWIAPDILNTHTINNISGSDILNEVIDKPIDVSTIFGDISEGNSIQSFQRMKLYDFLFFDSDIINLGITNGYEILTNEEGDTIARYMVNVTQKDGNASIVYIDVNFTKSTYSTKINKINSSLSDAPEDGNIYGRKNGNWAVVSNNGTGGDNSFKLSPAIVSLQTGSTSEEISAAVGGVDGYNDIIQAVKSGKQLYISEGDVYISFTSSVFSGYLIIQGICPGIFGAEVFGVLNIMLDGNTFSAVSVSVNSTEIPSK